MNTKKTPQKSWSCGAVLLYREFIPKTIKVTQDNPRETWLNVPLQDFTTNSDIDWSKSVSEIDKQLYKKYGLSAEEISFIESKVREM